MRGENIKKNQLFNFIGINLKAFVPESIWKPFSAEAQKNARFARTTGELIVANPNERSC